MLSEYLGVFFSDWDLTTDKILTLLENSARLDRETLVYKPD